MFAGLNTRSSPLLGSPFFFAWMLYYSKKLVFLQRTSEIYWVYRHCRWGFILSIRCYAIATNGRRNNPNWSDQIRSPRAQLLCLSQLMWLLYLGACLGLCFYALLHGWGPINLEITVRIILRRNVPHFPNEALESNRDFCNSAEYGHIRK